MSEVDRFVATRPPSLTAQSVARLLTTYFGFTEVSEPSIKSLPSYYDRNYYFKGKHEAVDHCEYILKVMNPTSTAYKVVDGIIDVMKHLHSNGFPCPQPIIPDKLIELSEEELSGKKCHEENGIKYPIFALSFIPGEVFSGVNQDFRTPELFREVGKLLGRLDKDLLVSSI